MKDRVKSLFRSAKFNATHRGVEFLFTFQEWIDFWVRNLGHDWMNKRGRQRGKYCMARKGDKGPYASWNVECKLTEDNCSARRVNRTSRGANHVGTNNTKAKLDAQQVLAIFKSKERSAEVAKRFGVHPCTINDIRKGRSWTHLTGL